ncbi:MAG: DUF1700 domain-containing protein [Bacilli bacterium]
MNKKDFLNELSSRLNSLSKNEKDDLIQYYDELIEDRKERTDQTEEEIISSLGSIDDIVRKTTGIKNEKIIIDDPEIVNPTNSTIKKDSKKKANDNNTIIKIILIAVTFPLWIGLLVGFIGVVIGLSVASVGIGIGGIACIVRSFFVLADSFGDFILHLGIGSILVGLCLIIIPSLIKLFVFLFNETKSFIEKTL